MFIPEIQLKSIIDALISTLKTNYEANIADETKSILYKFFNGNAAGIFNYFTEAKKLFLRDDSDQRKLDSRLFFDRERANIPTVHITLPNESPKSDGIGVDAGYQPEDRDDDDTFNYTYTRGFATQYNIIITSDNTFEVILIYHALKAMLIKVFDSLELMGFRDPRISGGDLNINPDLVPPGIFVRNISLSIYYEQDISALTKGDLISAITFNSANVEV